MEKQAVIVVDFGSQYTQLILRRVRELGFYSELVPYDEKEENITKLQPVAFILSGGPSSVYDEDSPKIPEYVFKSNLPVLGICYGLQALVHQLGGRVEKSLHREFGPAKLFIKRHVGIFDGLPEEFTVWMSHSDRVERLPMVLKPLPRVKIHHMQLLEVSTIDITVCNFIQKLFTRRMERKY